MTDLETTIAVEQFCTKELEHLEADLTAEELQGVYKWLRSRYRMAEFRRQTVDNSDVLSVGFSEVWTEFWAAYLKEPFTH